MNSIDDTLRNFGMANLLAENNLDKVEKLYKIDLGRPIKEEHLTNVLELYDFQKSIRNEATEMAKYYEIFYCLEVSIRNLISERLFETYGQDWWNSKRNDSSDIINQEIRKQAKQNQDNEKKQAMTIRSNNHIDYTTFGELSLIINNNWDIFGDMFSNQDAVRNVLARLNSLRSPIAHCSKLAEDEILRLNLALKDWFRTMG